MPATLKSVQWLSIQEVADMWEPHLDRPMGAILRELQFGWYKWQKAKAGAEGFCCGTPLDRPPPRHELPATDELIDREFLEQFATKQGWVIPSDWFKGQSKDRSDRYPGRPSNKRAIVQELRRIAAEGKLEVKVSHQARVLYQWANKNFPADQIPTVKVIENQIRDDYRKLKAKSAKQSH